jgi:hypothetical protein
MMAMFVNDIFPFFFFLIFVENIRPVFVVAYFTTFSVLDPVVVETYAMLRAVEFCRTWRFVKIIVEDDSLQVVKAIKHKEVSRTMYG